MDTAINTRSLKKLVFRWADYEVASLPDRIFKLLSFKEPKNRYQEINSASLYGLAGRYENPIPTRFLAPIDCLKIPAQMIW